jgi:AcrR family transcriptional regulator
MQEKKPRVRENPAVRRARIVDEAIRIVGERGYNGFTVQALAERCELTNAGLLHYFESKDKLLISLLEEIERREIDAISPAVEMALSDGENVDTAKQVIFDVLLNIGTNFVRDTELGRFLTVLLAESLDPMHPAHSWFRLVEDETRTLFARLSRRLVSDPESKGRQLLAAMHGLQLQWYRSGCGFDFASAWEVMICDLLPLGDPALLRKAKSECEA